MVEGFDAGFKFLIIVSKNRRLEGNSCVKWIYSQLGDQATLYRISTHLFRSSAQQFGRRLNRVRIVYASDIRAEWDITVTLADAHASNDDARHIEFGVHICVIKHTIG